MKEIHESALFREAFRTYLKQLRLRELKKAKDRSGYERQPDDDRELDGWERLAVWPEPYDGEDFRGA